jgi:hypothetical protein
VAVANPVSLDQSGVARVVAVTDNLAELLGASEICSASIMRERRHALVFDLANSPFYAMTFVG